MQYNQEAIKQAKEYTKYIRIPEIIDLVSAINKNETDFNAIKKLLIDCLNNQLQKLPIENDLLKQNVFTAFCLMVKNTETRIIHFGILKISYNNESTPRKPTIPAIKTIAKLCVDEWIQSHENGMLNLCVNNIGMNANVVNVLDLIETEENNKPSQIAESDSNKPSNNSMSDNQKISSIRKIDILYKGWRDVYDRWCVGSLEQVTHLFETEYPIYENGQRGEFNKSTIGFSTVDYQVEFEKYEIELIPANSPIFDFPEQNNNSNAYSIRYNQYYSVTDEYKISKTESKQLAIGIVGYVFVKLNEGFYNNFHIQIPAIGSAEFYQFFFDKQFDAFKQNRHDAWRDDLINEFMPIHIRTEQENIKQSEILFEHFPKNERNVVLKYVKSYFDYLKYKFSNIIKQENPQSNLFQSKRDRDLIEIPEENDKFNSLVNDCFSIDTLKRQIEDISTLQEKEKYIEHVIDSFNMTPISIWMHVLDKQNQFNVKYGTNDFFNATGTFGLYIDNPDEMPFEQTTLGMKFMMILNDFIRKCELLQLKIKRNIEFANKTKPNQTQTTFSVDSLSEGADSLMFKCNEELIAAIHDHCNNDIFICAKEEFVKFVNTANFSTMQIKKKSKVKLLIYYLSKQMGSVWYEKTAESLGYKKSDCSGANVTDSKWKKQMQRIIPQ